MPADISKLHPIVRGLLSKLIEECKTKGMTIIVTQGFRSIEEQNKLYEKGRTKPGKIVTNAKGGHSFHNYGLAFDIALLKNKKLDWKDVSSYKKIGLIGTSLGLT